MLPMPAFHADWINLAKASKRLMLLAPRDHAKSSVLSIEYPIWKICKWRWDLSRGLNPPHPRIGIVSDTEDQAESILRAITRKLTENASIIRDFGKFKPDNPVKWTTLSLIVDGWHAPNEKDTTFWAGGYESAWLGHRFDILVVDDLPNLKRNSATEDARGKLLQWWREVMTNTLEEESQVLYVATMQHHQDLTNQIIQEERLRRKSGIAPIWTIRRYRAILEEPTPTTPAKVLWKEHFSYESLLERKREIGTASFEKQFQNIPVNEDILAFRAGWLRDRCLDRGRAIGEVANSWGIYIGVDPALGESQWSSFFALVVLGIDLDKTVHVIDYFKDKIPLIRQEKIIAEYWDKYQPLQVRIETVGYQKALAQALKEKYPLMRVLPHLTARNKIDPESGVVSLLAPLVENGTLRIPYRDALSIRKMDAFIDDLVMWPANNADLVMALWIATYGAHESSMMAFARNGEWGTSVKNPMYVKPAPKEPEPELFVPQLTPRPILPKGVNING